MPLGLKCAGYVYTPRRNMIDSILRFLSGRSEVTVVVATHRLARRLLHGHNRAQLARGLKSWPTPDVLSWQAWAQSQWRDYATASGSRDVVLSPYQELQLWQTAIEGDADYLINAAATARQARAARRLVVEYQLDIENAQTRQWFETDADAARWLQWHKRYDRALRDQRWLDEAAMVARLVDAFAGGDAAAPARRICLVGFDELTPLQETLRRWLQSQDLWLEPPAAAAPVADISIRPCADGEDEIRQAARWARARFESHWQEGDAPVGVVVPRLEQRRDCIERVFGRVFYPADGVGGGGADEMVFHGHGQRLQSVFNLSMGRALRHEPMVAAALDILSLTRRRFLHESLSRAMRSPFIRGAAEHGAGRSLLDKRLRRRAAVEAGLSGLLAAMARQPCGGFDRMLRRLDAMRGGWRGEDAGNGGKAGAYEWVRRFQQALSVFGWPGDGAPDGKDSQTPRGRQWRSYRRQVMDSLDAAWLEFARADAVAGPITLEQALGGLSAMLGQKVFQVGGGEAPVQIIGMTESAGLSSSSLWVAGMTEQNFPAPVNPNPFIPLRLQREHDMPHSSPQWEYERAARQTRRLAESAQVAVFSHSTMEGEEALTPSPLLRMLPRDRVRPADTAAAEAAHQEQTPPAPPMTAVRDDRGPAADAQTYTAPAAALKDQSHCPFRAFVKHRLHADAPEQPAPGSDHRQRGDTAHEVLHRLLPKGSNNESIGAIDAAAIDAAVDAVLAKRGGVLNRGVERQRLKTLVGEWLAQEKLRGPFEIIAAEEKTAAAVGELRLRLRTDRIDRAADGGVCVIDYKTGRAATAAWVGERPDEPQLPLYAVIQQSPVRAVAFAAVRAGECEYVGAAADKAQFTEAGHSGGGGHPKIVQIPTTKSALKDYPDWNTMLDRWRDTLQALAKAHLAGRADLAPKNPAVTCRHCDAQAVCRIFEHAGEVGEAGSLSRDASK